MNTTTQIQTADTDQLVEHLRAYADETGLIGEAAQRLADYAAAAEAERDEEDAKRRRRLDDLSDRLSDMLEKLGDFSAELQRESDA